MGEGHLGAAAEEVFRWSLKDGKSNSQKRIRMFYKDTPQMHGTHSEGVVEWSLQGPQVLQGHMMATEQVSKQTKR